MYQNPLSLRPLIFIRHAVAGWIFTLLTLLGWFLTACFQSITVAILIFNTSHGTAAVLLGENEQTSTALVAYTACVLIQCLIIFIKSTHLTVYNLIVIIGTEIVFFTFNFFIALIPSVNLYQIIFVLLADPIYWMRVLLITTSCILPVLGAKYYKTRYHPTSTQQARTEEFNRSDPVGGMSSRLLGGDHYELLPSTSSASSSSSSPSSSTLMIAASSTTNIKSQNYGTLENENNEAV